MWKRYKLDVRRDVDLDGDPSDGGGYVLNLIAGWRFCDEVVHTRGYDTMREVRAAARDDVIPCDCAQCKRELAV